MTEDSFSFRAGKVLDALGYMHINVIRPFKSSFGLK